MDVRVNFEDKQEMRLMLVPLWVAVAAKTGTSMRKFALQSDAAVAGLARRSVMVEPLNVIATIFPRLS